jgi:O-antigen/teichoic acid export membrane protein
MLGIFLLLLARHLSVVEFGQFVLAYTLGIAVGLAVGFGASVRVIRANALDDGIVVAHGLYVVHSVATAAAAAVALAGVALAGGPVVLLAGLMFAYSDTVQNYGQAHLSGVNRHKAASALIVGQRLIPLVACVSSILVTGSVNMALIAAVFAITAAIALAAPLFSLSKKVLGSLLRGPRKLPFRGAASYWMLSVSSMVTQLQVPGFALFASAATLGFFSMATRVTGPLTLLSAAISTVLIPELSARVRDNTSFTRLSRRYVYVAACYCGVIFALAWPMALVVVKIVGDKYQPALAMLIAMMMAAGLSSVSQAISCRVIALGRPSVATIAILFGGLLTLAIVVAVGAAGHDQLVWIAPVLGQVAVLILIMIGDRRGRVQFR